MYTLEIFIYIEDVYTGTVYKVKEERFFLCIFLCTYDIVFCVMLNKLSAHIE